MLPPDAIAVLTTHALTLAQVIEELSGLLHRTTADVLALQTAILTFGDVVENLQRRVDRLERQAPLRLMGRVQ